MTPKIRKPSPRVQPPKHLKPATRAWFRAVVSDWELEDHHTRLLALAGGAWDRAEQAREVLETAGIVVMTRFGEVKAHPAVAIERDARIAFARLVRELDLDVNPPSSESRPPKLRSIED